jgi:hypothetical protein
MLVVSSKKQNDTETRKTDSGGCYWKQQYN